MIITSIGMDPDVHTCAFAWLLEDKGTYELLATIVRQPELTGMASALKLVQTEKFKDLARIRSIIFVAEGQDARYAGRTSYASPQDLLPLAAISGAAICLSTAQVIYNPLPREWKGTVRKDIMQKRILDRLGIKYEMHGGKQPYPVPVDYEKYCTGKVNQGDWKDITDAVGLAFWGIEKYKKEMAK